MGIIDTIKEFFQKRELEQEADNAIAGVKAAAESENYNQATLKAFYALETIGSVFVEQEREESQTAREYVETLTDEGHATAEELEPIVLGFEVAKYSNQDVSFDDYSKVESSLESVAGKFKQGGGKKKGKKRRRKRRKPKKGGRTGAARSGRKRSRSSKK